MGREQSENIQLTLKLHGLSNIVRVLKDEYAAAKGVFFLARYGMLKDMLRTAVTRINEYDPDKNTFGDNVRALAVKEEKTRVLSNMSKQDIIEDSEKIRDQINLIQHLDENYRGAKRMLPPRKYGEMKRIAKRVIQQL
ncbi:uncharacterized protein LOC124290518 [Haliotis rubra]|uniref:uncharacterized protein LOC124290518 n=1 Tax=Haliotis rubra TaxID=36100 RepID=UPI001EE4F1B1|nr:uncharacterized protein LOC124290518 [Haliotis rubra]